MNTSHEVRSTGRSTAAILLVVAFVALLLIGPSVLTRSRLGSAEAAVAGLPIGHAVIGSVYDGVGVPYSLDLKGALSARVVLTIDGQVVSDVTGAPGTGTVVVPGHDPRLRLDDNAQLTIVAKAPDGTVLDSATGVGSIADGVKLPVAFSSYYPQMDLPGGAQRFVSSGQTIRFLGKVETGGSTIPLSAYNLTVDGHTILAAAPKDCVNTLCDPVQWIDGSWTAPTTPGDHAVVLSASARGDSRVIRQTYTLTVQADSSWNFDSRGIQVDPVVGYHLHAILQRAVDYKPMPNVPVELWRSEADGMSWAKVQDLTTDAWGVVDTILHPTTSGYYQLRTAGVPGLIGPSTTAIVNVEVHANVGLIPSKTVVVLPTSRRWSTAAGRAARTVAFSVNAPVGMGGCPALLQLWNGQTWNAVAWGTLGADGQLSLRYYVGHERGDYKFGILTGRNANYAPTTSADVHVLVR